MAPTHSRLSLQWKLPIIVGGLLIAVSTALCWSAYHSVSRAVVQGTSQRLRGVTSEMVGLLQAQARQTGHRVALLGAQAAVQDYFRALDVPGAHPDTAALRAALPHDSTILAIELWDAAGQRRFLDGPSAARVLTLASDDLREPSSGPDSGRVGRIQALNDTVVIGASGPVMLGSVLAGHIVVWRRLSHNSASRAQITKLIGDSGTLLIGSNPGSWTDQERRVAAPPAQLGGTARYRGADGRMRVASIAPVTGTPWLAAVELREDLALAPVRQFLAGFVAVALVILALGLAVAWTLSRRITMPLGQLTATADAISAGNHSRRAATDGDGELGRLSAAFNQMMDRVDDEARARQSSEEQWRLLFEHNPHPMWVYDTRTTAILRVNEAAIRHYGYSREEFVQLKLRDLWMPDELPRLNAKLEEVDPKAEGMMVARHRKKDGTAIQVEARGRPLELTDVSARVVSATDITDRTQLEEQLRQSQKMEAIGRLAGGVAHDFNNILMVIYACCDQLSHSDAEQESVEEIRSAASRAAALTGQLLAFSRKQIVKQTRVELNKIIAGIEPMLARLLFANIEFVTRLCPENSAVLADQSQMEQVVMNLVVNASDAMPGGGTLTVETAVVDLDGEYAHNHLEITAGRYVMLAVADTGVGMDPETVARVFEPFFTTKPIGTGTGLGLSTVYGIVKQAGGHVWVYSEPGHGATFKIYLPAVEAPSPADRPAEVSTEPVRRAPATVLLVEDEPAVRTSIRRMLEHSGFTVIDAAGGMEAIELARTHPAPIHAVVTDLMMPGMDGRSVAEAVDQVRPGLGVVFISGYTEDAVIRRGLVHSAHAFVQKPFRREDLARAIDGVLRSTA